MNIDGFPTGRFVPGDDGDVLGRLAALAMIDEEQPVGDMIRGLTGCGFSWLEAARLVVQSANME